MKQINSMLTKPLKPSIGILLWDDFLTQIIEGYLTITGFYDVQQFQRNAETLSAEFVDRLKKRDLFITEAFNPNKIWDAEGFRLALKLIELGFKAKPIVIFRTIEEKYLIYPYFLDFKTIDHLPEKMETLLASPDVSKEPFDLLARMYPILSKVPEHKRVVLENYEV